jgi:transcriptional regulator with GAF, ATPase, and Fis domain
MSSAADLPGSSLDKIALEMTSTLDLGAVLGAITSGLVGDFGVALARVWLTDPGGATLSLRASSGLSARTDGAYARVAVGSRKIGHIAETQRPLATNDVAHDEHIVDRAWVEANGLVSFAGWPLTFRGSLEGVLATFARRPLSDAERARMALFAHQAAIAIKNARLFAEVAALEERLRAENAYLRTEARGGAGVESAAVVLARCEGLRATLTEIRRVAPTSTTVLVQGETGTGKELVARALHEMSPRRGGPFVRVNCAALAPTLIESELFGHERGAFTGAHQRRLGRFELADRGTLLLDEVGELPVELQAKLLRVLQEQEFERLGGTRPVRVDVRVVASTNRDLARAVKEGRFREDLFFRLAVFAIRVPALRDRAGDCAVLADAFVREQARRLGKPLTGLAPSALDRLLAHRWPGNVRELANAIERAAIVAAGPTIEEDDLLPLAGHETSGEAAADAQSAARPKGADSNAQGDTGARADSETSATLEAVERAHIVRTLERTGWVIEGKKGAATVLGVAPSTLRSRMAQLGIRRAPPAGGGQSE